MQFADNGATVVVADTNLGNAQKVVDEIARLRSGNATNQGKALSIKVNVTKYSAVEKLIQQTVSTFGKLDIMVNNAGIGPSYLKTHEATMRDWNRVISVNQTGAFYGIKLTLQQFVQQGYGNIVNMASLAGLKAYPNNISYGVSKFAVVAMTKSAALEYADYNI